MGSEQKPKRQEIDYRNPPSDLAYIALSDLRSAYKQGRKDVLQEQADTRDNPRPGVHVVHAPGQTVNKTLDEIISEGLIPEQNARLHAQSKARFDAIREAERLATEDNGHRF